MELRWILILAGLAIFGFLYFSGRQKKYPNAGNRVPEHPVVGDSQGYADQYNNPRPEVDQYAGYQGLPDNAAGNAADPAYPQAPTDVPGQAHTYSDHPAIQHDHYHPGQASSDMQNQYGQVVADPLMESAHPDDPANRVQNGNLAPSESVHAVPSQDRDYSAGVAPAAYPEAGHSGMQMDPNDMQRPADSGWDAQPLNHPQGEYGDQYAGNYPDEGKQGSYGDYQTENVSQSSPATRSTGGLSGLLSQLSGGLLGRQKRSNRQGGGDADALYSSGGIDPFVITLHIVAPDGQIIHGPRLQSLFEQRGYHYGQMNIYHSLNQGSIVFSIAKMVEPGTFEPSNPDSYETPGVTMILQLPAPVAADVAFEVFVSEARELAGALGCTIIDSDFSSLSQQTVQHLRDSVHQFMHKQRLAETVPS